LKLKKQKNITGSGKKKKIKNNKENLMLPDIQKSTRGFNKIPINKVGVRNIKIPMNIKTKQNTKQHCLVSVSSYCNLVESVKGINMSRISRTLLDSLAESQDGIEDLRHFAYKLQKAHETDDIYIKAKFNYLVYKESPVTKIGFQEPIEVVFESILKENTIKNFLTVKIAGMSLCPCSKEMSLLKHILNDKEIQEISSKVSSEVQNKIWEAGLGAHNQLSIVEIKMELLENVEKLWIEDIVSFTDKCFSSPVFSVLKREDEKWVTEHSYLNPKFVEDITRDVAFELNKYIDKNINDYVVICNNQESIHNEMLATAILTAGRNLK
jgi:GTP cyclohydrolase IB